MTDYPTIILGPDRTRAHKLIDAAPPGSVLTIKPPKRTLAQNDKLHAMATDLMMQKPEGRAYPLRVWKALALAEIGKRVEFYPALSGQGMEAVTASTARLTKQECSDLIEALYEYGARMDVQWSEPNPYG